MNDEFDYKELQVVVNKLQKAIDDKSIKSCVIWAVDKEGKEDVEHKEGNMQDLILFNFHFHADLQSFRNEHRKLDALQNIVNICESALATKN